MTDTCVVTGGGRGIGRATALLLASRGLDVALLARTVEELESTAGEVTSRGRRALAIRCDVASSKEVSHAAERILKEHGAPRVLVHAAGIVRRAKIEEMSETDWNAVIDVNLKGPFLVTRSLLPAMKQHKNGRIVAIGSISSTIGTPRQSAYCASKWGLVGFVKSLAEELRGTGLMATAILPGSVDTEMLKGSGFEPLMTAEDVARAVVYSALDAPHAMNGSALEMFGP